MAHSNAYEKYPQHALEIDDQRVSLRIKVDGVVIAETTQALHLREGRYPAVAYIPREDVMMDKLRQSTQTTHCPFKGDATYFDFVDGDATTKEVAWSYEQPFDQMEEIRDHLAFYSDRVSLEILSP